MAAATYEGNGGWSARLGTIKYVPVTCGREGKAPSQDCGTKQTDHLVHVELHI